MFYSYKNCKILINGLPFYVQSASLSEQNSVEPGYNIDNRYNINYTASNGIGGSINLTYLLTGADSLVDYISLNEEPIQIDFGGIHLNSGYLKSYGFDLQPNQPINISSQIIFFDTLTGIFNPNYQQIDEHPCLNAAEVQVSNFPGSETRNIVGITKLNYQYEVDIQPHYSIGDTIPNRVVFGERSVSCNVSSEKIDPFLNVSGNLAHFRVKLNHPTNTSVYQNFDVRGIVNQKNFSTTSDSILDNTISIQQNNLENFNPVISAGFVPQNIVKPTAYFITPSSGYYGTNIIISGINFRDVNYVTFNSNKFSDFEIINDNQINVTIPDDTISGPMTLHTDSSSNFTKDTFFIGGLPISINSITYGTGNPGETVVISGNNFHEISRVIFSSGQETKFAVINKNLIEASIPQNAYYGKVRVVSDIFNISGESSQIFVPIPTILGFSPLSGFTGEYITVSGFGFEGLNGIKINNLPTGNSGSFSIVNNTGILLQIPSGNTKGKIRLYGQSGVTSLSKDEFYPYGLITGISPISGRTGESLRISGKNFLPEILYNNGSSRYAVSFNGGVTGNFTLTNSNTVLTGFVPYGAKSGIVKVYSQLLNEYPSSFSFYVRNQPPSINYINPISGKSGDFLSLVGENLVNVNSLVLTGNNTGHFYSSSSINISVTENYINFQLPKQLTGGRYNAILNTIEGNATGSGVFVMQQPYVSGFSPISGGIGTLVTVTGLDIYPFLTDVWLENSGYKAAINTGSLNYNNNTVQFLVPNNLASGNHKVVIYNSVNSGSGSYPFKFIPYPSPSGFTPISGEWNNTILISGSYFDLVSNISISNLSATFNKVGSTGLYFSIPNNATTDYIKLTNSVGYNFTSTKLIINPPLLVISGFRNPTTYYNSGLIVSGLYLNTLKEIRFSGFDSEVSITNFTVVESTGAYVNVPGAISGGHYIKFVNDRGNSYSPYVLNLILSPVLNSISLQTGVFKDVILISGSGLSGSLPYFNGISGSRRLGDNISIINDSGLYFRVPSGIVSDNIIIKGRNDTLVYSDNDFVVLPTISGLSGYSLFNSLPSFSTGSYITISGINAFELSSFIGISGADGNYYNILYENEFTGVYRTGYSTIRAKIGNTYAGTGKLFLATSYDNITNITGSQTYVNINKVLFNQNIVIQQPSPTISSVFPNGSKNTLVTLLGSNLFSTKVTYSNGVIFATGTLISKTNNQIISYPPNIESGFGIVSVSGPFGSDSVSYVILPVINISGYTPVSALPGTLIRITGSGLMSITGISFGLENTSFNGLWENNTFILSGVVPSGDCCGEENVLICVRNEGDTYCL